MADDPSSLCTSSHLSEGKINKKKSCKGRNTSCVCTDVCHKMVNVGVCKASMNIVHFRRVDAFCVLQQELTYAEM